MTVSWATCAACFTGVSEKFSHALSVLNVLLADRCALSLALPLHTGHSALMIRLGDRRRYRLRWTVCLALVFCAGACGSDRSADHAHFVCFQLATADGQAINSFLKKFFVDGQQRAGMDGYSVQYGKTSRLSIDLAAGTDAETWLEALPLSTLHDSAVSSYAIDTSDCAAAPAHPLWHWLLRWIVVPAGIAASALTMVLIWFLVRNRRARLRRVLDP